MIVQHTTHIWILFYKPIGLKRGQPATVFLPHRCLNTKSEFDADIDIAGHLDDLAELDRLLSGGL